MIFRQNLGINRFHRTVVICTFKIQIYLRVHMEIFTRYQNIYGHCTCRGAMDNKDLSLWCRRGLLAYVYSGVSNKECMP